MNRNDRSGKGRRPRRGRPRSPGRKNKAGVFWIIAAAFAIPVLTASLFAASAQAATASWSFEPSSWDFGLRAPEAGPSEPQAFALKNTGEVALSPGLLTLDSEGDFRLDGNSCHSTLAPGADCAVRVTFEPSEPGLRSGELEMQESADRVPPALARVTGTGAAPEAELLPSEVDFGTFYLGSAPPTTAEVRLTNRGQLGLSISSVSAETNLFTEGDRREQFRLIGGSCVAGATVAAGASCSVDIEFTPTEPFTTYGHLSIKDNAPGSPQRVSLTGTGSTTPPSVAPRIPAVVRQPSWVEALNWTYVGTRGRHVLRARVNFTTACTATAVPVITPEVRETKRRAVVTMVGRFPAVDRLEGSACEKRRGRRILQVRLRQKVSGLALYDGSQKPLARRGPVQ